MVRSRPDTAPEDLVDLAPDIIDFGDMAGRGMADAVFFPASGELVGILPDFLCCPKGTVVAQRPVGQTGPAQDAGTPRDLSAGLDGFDFT